jgi:lysyl-tRNA synthetase class 2
MENKKDLEKEISKYIEEQDEFFRASYRELNKEGNYSAMYPYKFEQTDNISGIIEKYRDMKAGTNSGEYASIAGRVMRKRIMGGVIFFDIQQDARKIQIFASRKELGTEDFNRLKKANIGDIYGFSGEIIKTKKGELSLYPHSSIRLSKTLKRHPDKFHGLTDIERKYRQRYLDLLNPETAETFKKRTKIVNSIRKLLDDMGFLEVETPILQPIYGGANSKPFKTYYNALKRDMFLRISNELYLKRLIIGGLSRVYEFSKDFRNEDIDSTHNPEFTQLELYAAYMDYRDIMDISKKLFKYVSEEVNNTTNIEYQGVEIDLSTWNEMTMEDAVKKYAEIDWRNATDEELKEILDKNNIEQKGGYTKYKALNWLFEKFAEPNLIQPTIIMDFPKEISPLAKQHRSNEGLVERFEIFING